MARAIGRTKSWAWYLAGVMCAVVFGRAAAGEAVAQPEYGIRVRRPVKLTKPAVTKEQKEEAAKLVDKYMAASDRKITDTEKKKIARLVRELGDEKYAVRENASKAIVKYGSKALKQLKVALKSKDAEVAQRAEAAISAINSSGGSPVVTGLRRIRAASIQVIGERRSRWEKAAHTAELQALAFKAQKKTKEAEKKLAEKKQAGEKAARLKALLGLVGAGVYRRLPGRAVAKYGVRRPILLR